MTMMSTTLLYHECKDVKIVSGPMFYPHKHQHCLCNAPDEPCVVTPLMHQYKKVAPWRVKYSLSLNVFIHQQLYVTQDNVATSRIKLIKPYKALPYIISWCQKQT